MRGRLHDLAGADGSSLLDEAAQERILALVREEGPRIVRAAKRRRFLVGASGFAAVAAAAAVLFAMRHPAEVSTEKVASGNAPVCASRVVPASAKAGFVGGASGAELDLGSVAFAASMPGTSVHLEEASPCRTIIALDSGTVAVHAKDLGGGELRVRTSRGDVVVHGTIFAVTRDETSLAVEVVVGNVSVTDRDDTHSVTTGQRLLLSAVGAAQGPLGTERAASLRASLGVKAVTEAEAPPAPAVPETASPGVGSRVAVASPALHRRSRTPKSRRPLVPVPSPRSRSRWTSPRRRRRRPRPLPPSPIRWRWPSRHVVRATTRRREIFTGALQMAAVSQRKPRGSRWRAWNFHSATRRRHGRRQSSGRTGSDAVRLVRKPCGST